MHWNVITLGRECTERVMLGVLQGVQGACKFTTDVVCQRSDEPTDSGHTDTPASCGKGTNKFRLDTCYREVHRGSYAMWLFVGTVGHVMDAAPCTPVLLFYVTSERKTSLCDHTLIFHLLFLKATSQWKNVFVDVTRSVVMQTV